MGRICKQGEVRRVLLGAGLSGTGLKAWRWGSEAPSKAQGGRQGEGEEQPVSE